MFDPHWGLATQTPTDIFCTPVVRYDTIRTTHFPISTVCNSDYCTTKSANRFWEMRHVVILKYLWHKEQARGTSWWNCTHQRTDWTLASYSPRLMVRLRSLLTVELGSPIQSPLCTHTCCSAAQAHSRPHQSHKQGRNRYLAEISPYERWTLTRCILISIITLIVHQFQHGWATHYSTLSHGAFGKRVSE